MKWPRVTIDPRDLHVYGGLVLAAWGGWHLSPPWTCVLVGAVLVSFGVFVPRKVT